jgi:hypothetical protein
MSIINWIPLRRSGRVELVQLRAGQSHDKSHRPGWRRHRRIVRQQQRAGNPEHFLKVDEVVDVVRFLLKQGDNVKPGSETLIRTLLDPFEH